MQRTGILAVAVLVLIVLGCLGGTLGGGEGPRPGELVPEADRRGQELVVCGQHVHAGTRIVLWKDPGGFDAYSEQLAFPAETGARQDPPRGKRYGTRRQLAPEIVDAVAASGWTLPRLQRQVRQFVFHYDVCGTSRQCFKVLHDLRGLSVHFLLDVDGTIYQTLDLQERAWHAGSANDASIGIEIAQIGAYPREDHRQLATWYDRDAEGPFVVLPAWMETSYLGVETTKFRPARPEKITGELHGERYWQYDFTSAQYDALLRLCAALSRVLPRLRLEAPRDVNGAVRRDALSEDELARFEGFLGHWHVTRNKIDPGPAFDWERVLGAR